MSGHAVHTKTRPCQNPRSGRLFVQCYATLAARFLEAHRPLKLGQIHQMKFPVSGFKIQNRSSSRVGDNLYRTLRYKLRPKFHQFHCQIICHAAMGSKLNMRYGSCFNEEDLIGKIVAITKGSMHGSSVSKRLLQRWLLQMNAHLAEKMTGLIGKGRPRAPMGLLISSLLCRASISHRFCFFQASADIHTIF